MSKNKNIVIIHEKFMTELETKHSSFTQTIRKFSSPKIIHVFQPRSRGLLGHGQEDPGNEVACFHDY